MKRPLPGPQIFRATDGARYQQAETGSLVRIDSEAKLNRYMKQNGLSGRQRRKMLKAMRRESKG